MLQMMQWATETLQAASMGPAAVPLALLLGLVSAVASACCALPAMGMRVAYSGTREEVNRRTALASAVSFMVGTTLALIVLGFVAGFVGQTAPVLLGRYWKVFAGLIAIVLGLAALKMLPLKLPQFGGTAGAMPVRRGVLGVAVVGLLMGGGVAACSLGCNPGIYIVLGASVLQGHALWGMVLMAAFGIGFSLPLSAILFGVSFGKASLKAQKGEAATRMVTLVAQGDMMQARWGSHGHYEIIALSPSSPQEMFDFTIRPSTSASSTGCP